ncbi:MAG: hypothetical protein WDM92_01930 [Caulobacteraceae bacterium]
MDYSSARGPRARSARSSSKCPTTSWSISTTPPSHSAFARDRRQLSHGCIRLERPLDLADRLFRGSSNWTPDIIRQTIAAKATVRADLPRTEPVFLLYWTAFTSPDGTVNFRDDAYKWDAQLLGMLGR